MKFYIYSVYDPEVESFDSRLNLGPLDPIEMGIQYKRAFIKMNDADKAFMSGKVAVLLGEFDDESGKIKQGNLKEIFKFELEKKPSNDGESQVEVNA